MPALARQGLVVKAAKELTAAELGWVESYFREQVYPVLTPLALDAARIDSKNIPLERWDYDFPVDACMLLAFVALGTSFFMNIWSI